MAVETVITTRKPETGIWWWEMYPEKMQVILDHMKSHAGFISYASTNDGDSKRVQTIVFDTQKNSSEYFKNLYSSCAEAAERRQYNDNNGISTSVSINQI